MSFGGKSFPSVDEIYATKIIEYFFEIWRIDDGEQKLAKVLDGEANLLWRILEGSHYINSKAELYKLVDSDRKKGRVYSKLHLANAICKLQQRAAFESGLLGKKGVTVITEKSTDEETKKIIDGLEEAEDNYEDAT